MNAIYRLKLYLALSRTPHGVLDMATPAFAVLLYLGSLPPFRIAVIGLITAFAGYTAIYALNDVIDYRTDREKCGHRPVGCIPAGPDNYLDALMVRHPMAEGMLTWREGVAWAIGWSAVAMIGAWLLNPACLLIFLAGAALETVYCKLWRVSPWRAVVSGFVKNMGAIAAVYAIDPDPRVGFMLLIFLCLFSWEVGGQNIPADWTDIELDRRLGGQTIPLRFGTEKAAGLALFCLIASVCLAAWLFSNNFPSSRWSASLAVFLTGIYLLIAPAMKLFKTKARQEAMALFNRASYFPPVLFALAWAFII